MFTPAEAFNHQLVRLGIPPKALKWRDIACLLSKTLHLTCYLIQADSHQIFWAAEPGQVSAIDHSNLA